MLVLKTQVTELDHPATQTPGPLSRTHRFSLYSGVAATAAWASSSVRTAGVLSAKKSEKERPSRNDIVSCIRARRLRMKNVVVGERIGGSRFVWILYVSC